MGTLTRRATGAHSPLPERDLKQRMMTGRLASEEKALRIPQITFAH
jgi:hypothetical protein